MQIIRSPKVYDVAIIGSGAGGGTAAKVLTEAGADVVLLEGGPMWDSAKDGKMFAWNYDSMNRGWGGDKKPFGEFDGCIGGWEIEGEPYTIGNGAWRWFRGRSLGGRTNHWGRISLRFGPDDFRGKTRDGHGDDWPITYEDIKPYYDKLDSFVGIFGTNHAKETGLHNEPDGIFLPPPKPRAHELLIKQACDKLKIPVVPSRLSILTKPHNGRAACHYCGQCGRGCATHSNFSSTSVMIPPALKTGKLTILANAMAREVVTNDEGLATGVSYVDSVKLTEHQVRAKAVVLAASCCESARLLLNSKSTRHPGGLANSSGVVGKYLTDSTGLNVSGFVPKLMDTPRYNADGVGGMHLYVPWWGDNKALGFPRGYHIELGGGFGMPGYGFGGGIQNYPQSRGGGYGKDLKDEYRRYYGSFVSLSGRGEQVSADNCYCEIDPSVVDKFGIPVLRFHHSWNETERLQAKHMQETFRSIITEMGGTPTTPMPTKEQDYGLAVGGLIIHEAGATRMGNDAKTSVLNRNCQAHDAKNVFVCDGGPFTSQADKNLTWTIMALAWRTSEHIADERKKGEHLMRDIKRRRVLQILGATPAVAALAFTEAEAEQAATQAQAARRTATAAGTPYKPKFFTGSEYATVVVLADLIIPKDERSGSASEAGAPEFVDHIVNVQKERQVAARGGLAWLDTESRKRFDKTFLQATDAQRRLILDDIAFPEKADKRFSHGVRFFSGLRDLVAAGFWSSKIGVKDLGYQGNVPTVWDGAPQAVLDKLGVKYDA